MGIRENELQTRRKLIEQMNLTMVMDHAREDLDFMNRLIRVLK